jgi:hypothetical protein
MADGTFNINLGCLQGLQAALFLGRQRSAHYRNGSVLLSNQSDGRLQVLDCIHFIFHNIPPFRGIFHQLT